MNTNSIVRLPKANRLLLTNSSATTPVVDYRDASDARVLIPTGYTSTELTFLESDAAAGTFVTCYDSDNTQVTLTVTGGRSYNLPSALFACHFLKIVSSADDSTKLISLCKKC